MVVGPATAGATLFGILVAALGESLAGLWSIGRGDGYLGGVLTTFGLWLFGYYMFLTTGITAHLFTPMANGLYILMLVIPVAFMTVPAVTQRRTVLSLAFVSLLAMLLALGFGSYY